MMNDEKKCQFIVNQCFKRKKIIYFTCQAKYSSFIVHQKIIFPPDHYHYKGKHGKANFEMNFNTISA